MRFYSKHYRAGWNYFDGTEIFPCIFLIKDWRNDYWFRSLFECYYVKSNDDLISLWYIKVIQKWTSDTNIPDYFTELEKDNFFTKFSSAWYEKLSEVIPEKIKEILESLQDIVYCKYDRKYIDNLTDEHLSIWYRKSLYRDDPYQLTRSDYWNNAKITIERIKIISNTSNDEFLRLLLYGSIVTTLESYLWDIFKSQVLSSSSSIKNFLDKYDWRRSEENWMIKLSDLYNTQPREESIEDYIKKKIIETMNRIIFHKIENTHALFDNILWIKLPKELFDFSDAVQFRHDIFHRNWKNSIWENLIFNNEDIQSLWLAVLNFIEKTEIAIDL